MQIVRELRVQESIDKELFAAIENNDLEKVEELTELGADPAYTSNEIGEEYTAVDYAKDSENFEVANYLLGDFSKNLI